MLTIARLEALVRHWGRQHREWWRYPHHNIRRWLLEDRWHQGLGGPPNVHRMSRPIPGRDAEYVGAFINDASEFWISARYYDSAETKWMLYCVQASVFRRLALYYIWRWAWGEWFGLRRWLYFRWLHRNVTRLMEAADKRRKKEVE